MKKNMPRFRRGKRIVREKGGGGLFCRGGKALEMSGANEKKMSLLQGNEPGQGRTMTATVTKTVAR